jgi:4-amino-4-deoxy-L-arabinose transferase-like glycosyltransferase
MATGTAAREAPARSRQPLRAGRLAAARHRLRRVPRPLALILLVGALQSVAWNVALPAFQGPDEDAHFAVIQHLAETGNLASPTSGGAPDSSEARAALTTLNLQPLIGNLTAQPAWSSVDLALWRQTERALPKGAATNGAGPNAIAKNPPLYYALMSIPYRVFLWLPLLKRLFVMRLFNALCYLATIAFSWLIAGEVLGRVRWKQALAAGVVALEPQLTFLSAVINADNLLIALTTAFLYAALRLVRRGPTMRRVLIASVLCAAASLTHGRGLVTVPVLLVALAAAWIRHRPAARATLYRGAAAAGTLATALIAYLLLGRPASSGSLYGGQVQALNSGQFNVKQFLSSIYQFYFPRLPSLRARIGPEYGYRQVFIDTFYGTFGSLEVTFKQRVYDTLQVLSALGLVGFYTACVVNWRRLRRAWPTVAVLLSLLLTTLFFLHYVSYRALLGNGGTDPLITGRYLLPMVSLFGLAIAFTVGSLPRRLAPFVAAVILALGVLLSLGGLGITMARFYA